MFLRHEKRLLPSGRSRISFQELKCITTVAAFLSISLFAQDATAVGKTSGDFLVLFFHKDYLSSPLLTALPHTMYNLRHPLTIVLSAFQEMSYFHQSRAGKLFQKMASRKGLDRVVWLGRSQRSGVLLLV